MLQRMLLLVEKTMVLLDVLWIISRNRRHTSKAAKQTTKEFIDAANEAKKKGLTLPINLLLKVLKRINC